VIRDALSYLYVNATVMAKEGKFISSGRWDDLWGCSSPGEIASLLEGTDYFPYLSEGSASEAKELERAIIEEFSAVGREISKVIPKRAWPIREYVLRKWDVINLRTVLRGIHGGLARERLLDSFLEGGELSFSFFNTLIDVESMDDFVALLSGTPYESLNEGLARYNETHNLFIMESMLDKIFWQDLWLKVLRLRGLREFREYIATRVETHNLKIILRAKSDGLLREDIDPLLIAECTIVDELLSAFDEEELSGMLPLLEGTPYFEPLVSGQHEYERTGSIQAFEEVLDGSVLQRAEDIRKKKPFGPGPLIGFLVLKEREVKNLLAIVRSTEVDLSREEIRESVMGE
jgi:V/A-type H+-transporting ATPase subunit C